MDKETLEALKEVAAWGRHASHPVDHIDAHYKAFKKVEAFIKSAELANA